MSYECFHNDLAANEHRGIIIYIKEDLKAVPIIMETDFCESLWVEITLGNTNTLLCGCIYRSPDPNHENAERLCDLIRKAAIMKNSHILITGDFNLPGIDWRCLFSSSRMENNFVEAIRDSYLFQHVIEPTRCRYDQNPSTLDLIFSNQEEMVTNIHYHSPLGKSDHSCITFDFLCQPVRHRTPRTVYFYGKADFAAMNAELSNPEWLDQLSSDETTEGMYREFHSKFAQVCNQHIPKRTFADNHGRKLPGLRNNEVKIIKKKNRT
jgi:hypothetical protein